MTCEMNLISIGRKYVKAEQLSVHYDSQRNCHILIIRGGYRINYTHTFNVFQDLPWIVGHTPLYVCGAGWEGV